MPEIVAIERRSFRAAWSTEHFTHEIAAAAYAVNRVGLLEGRVVAYTCVWEVDDELRINNVAVAPEHRGRGLGRWMVACAMAEAAARGCRRATLEVRPSNRIARRLYRTLGFRQIGRRPDYYSRDPEDALVLEAELGPGGPPTVG